MAGAIDFCYDFVTRTAEGPAPWPGAMTCLPGVSGRMRRAMMEQMATQADDTAPTLDPGPSLPVVTQLGAPLRLALIDDDMINSEIIARHLKALSGLAVTSYNDPTAALAAFHRGLPDLMIVDYLMPELDGLELIRRFRKQPGAEDVPILMITASATTAIMQQAMEIGANDFLPKPVDPVELVARTKNMMKLRLRSLELIELTEQLRALATTDDLTGLYNRRHFVELSNIEIERARRFRKPMSVIMIDADHFKRVNDSYGHAAGDVVLRGLADVMRETTRRVDIVGRLGGEEFAVTVLETGIEEAFYLAERIRRAVQAQEFECGNRGLSITISAGVAELGRDDHDIGDLLNRADKGLYQAKRTGRNRVMA